MMHNAEETTDQTPVTRPTYSGSLTAATLAVVNAVMHAGSAQAQVTNAPSADTTNATTQLPDVIVKSQRDSYKPDGMSSPKYTEPLRDIPQSVSVIPRAIIDDQGATTLREVLRNISGISMQAGEGGGGLPGDNLSIRGFPARSDIFIDGVRDYGAYARDIFNTEQVEVVKGPSSVITGRGTTGGHINLVSKTPKLKPSYEGTIGMGTDAYKRGTVDVNQPLKEMGLENSAVRLNLMANDANTPGRDVVKNQSWGMAPSVMFGLGKPTTLGLSYVHLQQNNVPDYGLPWIPTNTNPALQVFGNKAAPVSFDNFYGLKNYDYEDVQSDMATAIVKHEFNDSLTLRSLVRYGRTDRSSAITAPRFTGINTNDTLINRQLQRRDMVNEAYVSQTDLTTYFGTGPIDHVVVTGLELSREDQDNRNSAQTTNQPTANFYDPNPNEVPFGPMPANNGVPNIARTDTAAVYVFDTLKFGEKWILNGGVRFDHAEQEFSTPATNFNRTDNLPSWRAALLFKPKPNGSIYIGAGTSFNPSIEAGTTGLSLATNTAGLKPEETRMIELGTKWEFFEQRLLTSATVFRANKVNARTPRLNPSDPPTVLDGEVVAEGVELEATGDITENWSMRLSYTFLHTEVEKSNNPAEVGGEFPWAPRHSFTLWTTYKLPGNLQIGGGTEYKAETWNGISTVPNVRQAPDYWIFNAMLAYELNDNVSLQLNVNNLADQRYIGSPGGGHFIPGPGRSAFFTANFKF